MDLQLFSEERTEEASPRKLQEARKEGRAPRSQDLAAGIGLLVAATALRSAGPALYGTISEGMRTSFQTFGQTELTTDTLGPLFESWGLLFVQAMLPITGAILIAGVAVGLFQGRLTFTTKPFVPDFTRLNPATGLGRILSLQTVIEQVKALLKLAAIGYIGYQSVLDLIPHIPNLMGQNVALGMTAVTTRVVDALQTIGLGLLGLAVLDYAHQYWEFKKSLRMTKQEVKQEHKQQEGNPELKQQQRQRAREMARRRKALKEVPSATVIITNPTHFAVALRYNAGEDAVPKVVAKGTDLLAQRIKATAKKHAVPAVENRPLARALYATAEVGQSVPPELYQAVAEVLAFVYSLRRQQRSHRSSSL